MAISIYDKINNCVEQIFQAMLYVHFHIVKTSEEVLGINMNSALIRSLLLTITLLFVYIYLEKEVKSAGVDANYVLS